MLMTDDTGWNDFGAYSGGGAALGHPTPNIDQIAKEGATFTNWYGQASCTAGRASFITGRIPIRSALSIVVAPGDENRLRKETRTIAEFCQKNGYSTYFSGKWHLGDKPDAYAIEHGFDEMKHFAAYYAGVYSYNDTSKWFHPWSPSYNPDFEKMYDSIVNLGEWEGKAGRPAKMVGTITYDSLATFDIRQTDSAVDYIKANAKGDKPFFMDVNRYSGEDNGWALALLTPVIVDFDKSIMKYPSIKRYPGGASNDLTPDPQHPENPLPLLKEQQAEPKVIGGGGG